MTIEFVPFTRKHIPLWEQWIELPHVKDVWFIEGYEPSSNILNKIEGNGYVFPYAILIDSKPIGYIQSCDLFACKNLCPEPGGLFTNESSGTWCMDLFIGDPDYLDRGFGTEIVKRFCDKLFTENQAKLILIDPAEDNKRAIRCYEKAGFKPVKVAHDGVMNCLIMEKELGHL